MRALVLIAAFAPFLYYAARDNLFHFRGRRVSLTEHLLHLSIGVALLVAVSHAILGNTAVMIGALILFAIVGGIDEYVYHRGLPEVESDLHAKEHLALLIFVVVVCTVDWLETAGWRIPRLFGPIPLYELSGEPRGWSRAMVLAGCLAPYGYFGLRDNLHHARHRAISWTERALHLAIVLALLSVVSHALGGSRRVMIAALVLFVSARSLDEFVFHRGIAGAESDLHAKTHFAFLLFVIAVLAADWATART